MDNPETYKQHWTQDEDKHITEKLKQCAAHTPPKTEGEPRCSQRSNM